MTTKQWNRALVTGASSGIGREIARQLAQQGTDVVLVARDTARLEALAAEVTNGFGVEAQVLPADLNSADETAVIEARIRSEQQPVDLVVNNAGFGFGGEFAELDIDIETSVVQVNVMALHRLSHAAASTMKPRGAGGILNISSVAAYMPAPHSATYAATKAFVTSFGQSLHEELKPYGVTVTTSHPGFTSTEFQERAEFDTSDIPKWLWTTAADCARESLDAVDAGKVSVTTGRQWKVARGLLAVTPKAILRKGSAARNR